MSKFIVWEKREYLFRQEVEATSEAQALEIAKELGEWEQDQNHAEVEYEVEGGK